MNSNNNEKSHIKKQAIIDNNSLNMIMIIMAVIVVLLISTAIYLIAFNVSDRDNGEVGGDIDVSVVTDYPFKKDITVRIPDYADDNIILQDDIKSEYAALIDMTSGEIVASKKSTQTISPASMVKVMTLIVVYENLPNEASLDEKITISQSVADEMYNLGSSGYGFKAGEVLTVEDLIYALILQSDGIAAISLAEFVAGSEDAFVALMNEKASDMGLRATTFGNCTGLSSDGTKTTCLDMATIMMYAMQNPYCANVLSAVKYTPSSNFRAGEGCVFYHSFLVTKLENVGISQNLKTVEMVAGKTGWIGKDSGYCLVSYAVGDNGHKYVLVTANAPNKNEEVLDLKYIYENFAK